MRTFFAIAFLSVISATLIVTTSYAGCTPPVLKRGNLLIAISLDTGEGDTGIAEGC